MVHVTSCWPLIGISYNAISSETIAPIRDQKTDSDRFLPSLFGKIAFSSVRFDFGTHAVPFLWITCYKIAYKMFVLVRLRGLQSLRQAEIAGNSSFSTVLHEK